MGKLIETHRGVIYPWQCDHQGHLNTAQYVGIFDSYEQIVAICCEAWNKLIDQPWKIMSIGRRRWAHGF